MRCTHLYVISAVLSLDLPDGLRNFDDISINQCYQKGFALNFLPIGLYVTISSMRTLCLVKDFYSYLINDTIFIQKVLWSMHQLLLECIFVLYVNRHSSFCLIYFFA